MISLFLRKLLNSVSLCCILNISGHFLHPLKTSLSSGILVTLPDCPGLKFNTHILLFPFSRLMEMLNTLGARACVLEKYWVKGFNLGSKKKKRQHTNKKNPLNDNLDGFGQFSMKSAAVFSSPFFSLDYYNLFECHTRKCQFCSSQCMPSASPHPQV